AVSVCRSEAQRRGSAMELIVRTESDGRVALVGRPARLDETKEQPTRGGSVLLVLPAGYTLDHESGIADAPGSASADAQGGSDDSQAAGSAKDEEAGPKPLVVFWASGAASKGPGLYLHTRDGRVMGAEINSFT